MKQIAFHTLGCKVNSYETQAMEENFQKAGYTIVDFDETADIYVINTCSVTNIADRKSRQMLHRAKKSNPDSIVVAVGCYAQAAKDKLLDDESVDIVVGNNRKINLVEIVENYAKDKRANSDVIDIGHTIEYEKLVITSENEKTRAYVKVQDGCNQFCSYCIIPYTRGRVRSRKLSECLDEINTLASNGYKEVVLTGIHLSSYGVDFENENIGLIDLIEKIAEIDGIKRIRLGSLEPRIITEDFVKRLYDTKKVCPHFHLSLQSGCDTVLKRMNRRYDTKEFYEKCEILRKIIPDVMLTTDVIVGFPGETDEEFEETRLYLEKIKFFETHVFKYSRRQGTVADKLPSQIDESVKNDRSEALLDIDRANHSFYNSSYMDKVVEVLVEERVIINNKEYYVGHTPNYMYVAFESDKDVINTFVKVRLKEVSKDRLVIGKCEI